MIPALDSSFDAPTLAQAQAAYDAGVRVWGGYIATRPGLGLIAPWSRQAFGNVQQAGMVAIGFCSGWDDPGAIRALAADWGVTACLDNESEIRQDGTWVQPWLDASGAGLYGLCFVHGGRVAPFHILADYPGYDPGDVWAANCVRPAAPLGWQWEGTHTEFGLSVDRSWLDPALYQLLGGSMATIDQVFDLVSRVNREVGYDDTGNITPGGVADSTLSTLRALSAAVGHLTDLVTSLAPGSDAAKLDAVKAELDAVNAKIDAKFAGLKLTETT